MVDILEGSLLDRIRTENLDVYRASHGQRFDEDVRQEAQIAQDYHGRLVFELLQNADDAGAGQQAGFEDSVLFLLTDRELWVGNSGRPITESDVRGLCGVAASRKGLAEGRRRASIGHKGMGFKSILEITECPEVYSETLSFRFGPHLAREALQPLAGVVIPSDLRHVPILRFPWACVEVSETWRNLQARGIRTAFRFPLKANGDGTDSLVHRLADDLLRIPPSSLLFLKHLDAVGVEVSTRFQSVRQAWKIRRQVLLPSGSWGPSTGLAASGRYQVSVDGPDGANDFLMAHDPDIPIGEHRGGLTDPSWDGIEYSEISTAVSMRMGRAATLPASLRRLHVFLPTTEPAPYSILVSGAFLSDVSRQAIRLDASLSNYNSYLMQCAGRLIREGLIPALLDLGVTVPDILRLLDRHPAAPGEPCQTPAADALYRATVRELAGFPFLPSGDGTLLSLDGCAVPPVVPTIDEAGTEFRRLLGPVARSGDRALPDTGLCASTLARVLADHGARVMEPREVAQALANLPPDNDHLLEDPRGGIRIDPVLAIVEQYCEGLPPTLSGQMVDAVRDEALFPVGIHPDGRVRRIRTRGLACFYPPRSLAGEPPLKNLCFLAHDIFWGTLSAPVRNARLQRQMRAWTAIFDMREFKFPVVMQSAVLGALGLDDTGTNVSREDLRTLGQLSAICQLASGTSEPGNPLPYQRLGTNKAFWQLCRLDVPCRPDGEGAVRWLPAYRVYFGEDWIGDESVERVLKAARASGAENLPDIPFLVSPRELGGQLDCFRYLRPRDEDGAEVEDVQDLEGEGEDLDAEEPARWRSFMLWLGVNAVLRPVHFHDVEDRASGWLGTGGLHRPDGWAFRNIPSERWDEFVRQIRDALAEEASGRPREETPHFYGIHDLEFSIPLFAAAANDASGAVARTLFDHLQLNHRILERFSQALIALLPPGRHTRKGAKTAQDFKGRLVEAGPDFWVRRVHQSPICPTRLGPRRPGETWLPGPEVDRRFGWDAGSGRANLLPTLEIDPRDQKKAGGFCSLVGIRQELNPLTFGVEDARAVLENLRLLLEPRCTAGEDLRRDLREIAKPAYSNLVELLVGGGSGRPSGALVPLGDAPVLAFDGAGRYRFLQARSVYFVERADTRDRLKMEKPVWTFVVEARPSFKATLRDWFGMPVLEDELEWDPLPADPSLDPTDMERFRIGLRRLAPFILARACAGRVDEKAARVDARRIRQLVDALEPVERIEVLCSLRGQPLQLASSEREAFVQREADRVASAFVRWSDEPWPPATHQVAAALARAFCEALPPPSFFEAFLALALTPEDDDRCALLRDVGIGEAELHEARSLLEDRGTPEPSEVGLPPAPSRSAMAFDEEPAPAPMRPLEESTLARRTPLFSPEELLLDGIPISLRLPGNDDSDHAQTGRTARHGGEHGHSAYGGRTDLGTLDALGMYIAMSFERLRLQRADVAGSQNCSGGGPVAPSEERVFDVSTPQAVREALRDSELFRRTLSLLGQERIDLEHPGFDILVVDPARDDLVDRMIELKSSGNAARRVEMTWNEWKSASRFRERFWLYLVGGLRSDLRMGRPFLRAFRDPLGQLRSRIQDSQRRMVSLQVGTFEQAETLDITVRRQAHATVALASGDPVKSASRTAERINEE